MNLTQKQRKIARRIRAENPELCKRRVELAARVVSEREGQ